MYTGTINIHKDDVISMLGASDLLQIPKVKTACADFISNNIDKNSVCSVLLECKSGKYSFDTSYLMSKCLKYLENNATEVFQGEAWLNFDESLLLELLHSDKICIEETDLFLAILKWGKSRCKTQELKDVVANIINYVRFPLLPADFLVTVVKPTNLISKQMYMEALEWNISPSDAIMSTVEETRQRGTFVLWVWENTNPTCTFQKNNMTVIKSTQNGTTKSVYGNMTFSKGVHFWEIVLDVLPNGSKTWVMGVTSSDRSQTKPNYSLAGNGEVSLLQMNGKLPRFLQGDHIGFLLDMDNLTIDLSLNQRPLGVTGLLNRGVYVPFISISDVGSQFTLKFPPLPK